MIQRAAVLVENPDDRTAVKALGVADNRIFTIAGSGVETDKLTPLPEPPEPVTIAFAGRLLKDKGVRTLIEAHEILARRGEPVRLLIAGEPDPANPASIPTKKSRSGRACPGSHCSVMLRISVTCGKPHILRYWYLIAKVCL